MDRQQHSVSEIFRRAQAARSEHPELSYKQITDLLVKEFSGGPFPPPKIEATAEQVIREVVTPCNRAK